MVTIPSQMLKIGTRMPAFELPDYDGKLLSSDEYEDQPVLVIFLCNHCPYVRHIIDKLSERVREYQENGIAVVGISANDIEQYPEDAPDKMKEFADKHDFTFPYLFDKSQEVAQEYQAACTPDFFLFDDAHRLYYRGQFDDSRPKTDVPVTGEDLDSAAESLLAGNPIPQQQKPSVGCNIKWKPGNEPDYFG
ncbi:MAG TPA: thioredoxin family protein [bacterium]|nr:thioredoxin family protein [bacterium]